MKRYLQFFAIALVFVWTTQAQTVPNYVPTANLLGFWPFNGNANDLSGGGHHGTVNGALPTTDRFNVSNAAYGFNGAEYIVVPNHTSLSGFNDLTVSVWVNFANFNNIQNIVAKWYHILNCGSDNDTYLAAVSSNQLYWNTNNHNVALQSTPPTFVPGDVNQWKHLVFISDHLHGESIYVNGVLADTYTNSIGTICPSTNDLVFGAGNSGPQFHRFLSGKLDDIGVWNRVLTPCEITQLYTASVAAPLNVSASSPTVCAGKSATLSVTGTGTYTWNNVPGGSTLVVTPSVNTTYTVVGVDPTTSCRTSGTVSIQVVNCEVGLVSFGLQSSLKVFPNPSTGQLSVRIDASQEQVYTLFISDFTGKRIAISEIKGGALDLSVDGLQTGCYLLEISDSANRMVAHQKLLVKH